MDYGIIVDLETTGLSPETDEIIEIGIIQFGVGADGAPVILTMYGGLQEASAPLSPEITRLTGIKTEHLAGQRIDWGVVAAYFAKASVVVAHNAPFDAGFLKKRPELASMDLHWACSQRHIDWKAKGFGTEKLVYLAAEHGFINPFAHRALFDCATTFRLVQPYWGELFDNSYKLSFEIAAVGAPFEQKDALRERGYRWDPKARVWRTEIGQDRLEDERAFLRDSVYQGSSGHEEREIPPIW